MTTTPRNEAAERLRAISRREVGGGVGGQIRVALDLALAAERRATVERIEEAYGLEEFDGWADDEANLGGAVSETKLLAILAKEKLLAILAKEAAR